MSRLEYYPSDDGLTIPELRKAIDEGTLHTVAVCHHGVSTSREAAFAECLDGIPCDYLQGGLMRLFQRYDDLSSLKAVLIDAPMVYLLGAYYTDWMISFVQEIIKERSEIRKETGMLADKYGDPRIHPIAV